MEVEVKAKVENLDEIRTILESMGATFTGKLYQKDSVNKLKGEEKNVEPGSFMLRIREERDKNYLTFKAFTDRFGAWEEYETEILDPREMDKILKRVGFVTVMTLTKEREPGKIGKYSFNLDKIKELGDYIEVEIISDDSKSAQEEIMKFLKSLGINKDQFERRGYPEIVYAKEGIFSKGQK